MINKQKLWFLTLFTLILVLSVYYITMPTDLLQVSEVDTTTVVKETNEITVLNSLDDEDYEKEINQLEKTIMNNISSIEEVNNAYDSINSIKKDKAKSEDLETKIKNEFNLESFIKIENNKIKVTISSNDNSYTLANNIIRCIQEEFPEKMNISIQFK